jgi:hypothetical protein
MVRGCRRCSLLVLLPVREKNWMWGGREGGKREEKKEGKKERKTNMENFPNMKISEK